MKILYTPNLIVPSLDAGQRAQILEQAEIVDTDVLLGRVPNEVFVQNRRLRYYHSIGAGVDAILSPELVESDVIVASEKGQVGVHLSEHAFALLLALARGLHTA